MFEGWIFAAIFWLIGGRCCAAWDVPQRVYNRRNAIIAASAGASSALLKKENAAMAEDTSMFSPSFVQEYGDFTKSDTGGWSYRDVSPGVAGRRASLGDRVVFDWSGYTIGYFGRPFQAKGGPQGGAFDKDLDYARTILGSGKYVRGLEEALVGMQAGQVRQIVIPYGVESYPESDLSHDVIGPKPSTFSGQRALNFVLQNPRIDRTLLFNVKVIRVDQPDGKGGFKRGGKSMEQI